MKNIQSQITKLAAFVFLMLAQITVHAQNNAKEAAIEEKVNALTGRFREDGFEIIDGPRWTGDGYYETIVLDPEKNRIEITI